MHQAHVKVFFLQGGAKTRTSQIWVWHLI